MPDDAPADPFVRFVSSVEGRLVARWDAQGSSFGARVSTRAEREAGAEHIYWDTDCVVPLTAPFCAKYDRELRNAIRGGDLRERSREDWLAWLKLEEQRESERVKALEGAQTPEVAVESPVEAPTEEATPPPEAESKPEGRKKKT